MVIVILWHPLNKLHTILLKRVSLRLVHKFLVRYLVLQWVQIQPCSLPIYYFIMNLNGQVKLKLFFFDAIILYRSMELLQPQSTASMPLMAQMVNRKLTFKDCFIYNLIILTQNSILKFVQTPIIFWKPGYLLEKLKTLKSSNYHIIQHHGHFRGCSYPLKSQVPPPRKNILRSPLKKFLQLPSTFTSCP